MDFGTLTIALNMEIQRTAEAVAHLSQSAHIRDVLLRLKEHSPRGVLASHLRADLKIRLHYGEFKIFQSFASHITGEYE